MMETDIQKLRKDAWYYMSSNSKRYYEFCPTNNSENIYIYFLYREEQYLQDVESLKASGA
jgi:hypothetical protein